MVGSLPLALPAAAWKVLKGGFSLTICWPFCLSPPFSFPLFGPLINTISWFVSSYSWQFTVFFRKFTRGVSLMYSSLFRPFPFSFPLCWTLNVHHPSSFLVPPSPPCTRSEMVGSPRQQPQRQSGSGRALSRSRCPRSGSVNPVLPPSRTSLTLATQRFVGSTAETTFTVVAGRRCRLQC